jgi:Sulfocyanin (SoxE) domain
VSFVGKQPFFQKFVGSHSGTRPAVPFGTSVSHGNNTYGSYVQVLSGASNTDDSFGILINVNGLASSATARDALLTIGVDPAGGSSYSTLIPDLLVSCAGPYNLLAGGVWYYFPVYIPAGASIGAKGSTNAASTSSSVNVVLFCQPKYPHLVKAGSFVRAFGITAATSSGTAVTSGTTSEGTWTQISAATADALWFWQVGFGVNDSTMTALAYALDLGFGDGTSEVLLIENQPINTSAAEEAHKPLWLPFGYGEVASGTALHARLQVSGTADSSVSVAAYGVGG